MVGCRGYNIKNKDIYNKGYYRYAVSDGIDIIDSNYELYDIVYNTIKHIRDDNTKDMEIKDKDSNYLYTVNAEDLKDYEYGMLRFAIDRVKEERNKDIYYIYQIGVRTVAINSSKEKVELINTIRKYNDAYVKCYDDLLEILKEVESKYGKENIPSDYLNKINEIRRRRENILNGFSEEIMAKYNRLFKTIFN